MTILQEIFIQSDTTRRSSHVGPCSRPSPQRLPVLSLECLSQNFWSSSAMLGFSWAPVWHILGHTWPLIPVWPLQDPLQPPTRCLHAWTPGLSMVPVFPRHLVRSGCFNRVGTGFKVTLILRQVQTSRLPVSPTRGLWFCIDLCVSFCPSIGSCPSVFWLPQWCPSALKHLSGVGVMAGICTLHH